MSMQIPANLSRGAPDPRMFEGRPPKAAVVERPQRAESRRQSELDLKAAMEGLEKQITRFNRRFEFRLDQQINRVVVKVIDRDTDKLIKEIPPEEIQHLIARLRETMGLLVDEKI